MRVITINRFFPNEFSLLKISKILAFAAAFLVAATAANAQCSLACAGLVNVDLDADCMVPLVPTDILQGTPPCPGPYVLYLLRPNGDTIPNATVTGNHIGLNIMATVFHPASGNKCMGVVHVFDKVAPILTCTDVTVNCNADLSPPAIGFPTKSDNCGTSTFLLPVDSLVDGACAANFTQKIYRKWSAKDKQNNVGTCLQTITQRRPTIADVIAPPKFDTISVTQTPDPILTGQPNIGGRPVDMASCDIVTGYFDAIDTICTQKGIPGEIFIRREWLTLNYCPVQSRRDTQYILLRDLVPPTLTCPPATIVSTKTDECIADIAALPQPIVSFPDSVSVSSALGIGFGPFLNVPPGIYTLTYKATDCSHTTTCKVDLTVKDTQTPTAVLIANKVIALSSSGMATMKAVEFDHGSNDNCDPHLTFKVSTDGINFADSVKFNCTQVGQQVMVSVKVCEQSQPTNCTVGMVGISIQDKLGPTLVSCPKNLTVDCLYDYLNPNVGGPNIPVFQDNCTLDTVELDLVNQVSTCGEGTVKRIWTASDIYGNKSRCTQIVTVQNQHVFSQANITWPLNYMTDKCGASLALDSIPAPFKEPKINYVGCAQIATSYSDQLFTIGGPACNKIMRKWTIVDWCQYNPNDPTKGRWTYTQVLQVMDNIAPTLSIPADVTVGVGSDCLKGAVALPDATTTDCSTMLNIVNNSSYATSPAANASGNYPIGTHLVTFRATDGCGNLTQKTLKITVLDNKPPTAVCMNGLSTNLTLMANGPMVMLAATLFDAGSSDFCTPKNLLKIDIKKLPSSGPAAPSVTFDCTEKGQQIVELDVTDEKGNVGRCSTYVLIQDPGGLCPTVPNSKASIAGDIKTEDGKKVQGVDVQVTNYSNAVPVATDSLGGFVVPNLPMMSDYNIQPAKDGDDMNGVSTYDLYLLNQHILGVKSLPTPYKIIAGDINRSGTLTSFDMLELRKLILGIYPGLPANTSWRFVDKNFAFPNAGNPFATVFPEAKMVHHLAADSSAQFVGVKIGDLNGSAQTTNATANDDRSEMPDFELLADDQAYHEGDAFAFSIRAANRQELAGLAFTLEFDPEKIEFDDWAPGTLPRLSEGNLSFHGIGEGKITFCWGDALGAETSPGQTLVLFSGRAKTDANLAAAIHLGTNPTRTEAFGPDGEEMDVRLHFQRADGSVVPATSAYELFQNQPNPFTGATTIGFHLPTAKAAKLEVFDAAGRLVLEKNKAFDKGFGEWMIYAHELTARGVFSYRVSTDDWTATRKMVRN